jgi:hypothetical protein
MSVWKKNLGRGAGMSVVLLPGRKNLSLWSGRYHLACYFFARLLYSTFGNIPQMFNNSLESNRVARRPGLNFNIGRRAGIIMNMIRRRYYRVQTMMKENK